MRLLVHEWNTFTRFDIYQALREENIEFYITRLHARTSSDKESEEFKEKFEKILKEREYDAVFSVNFFSNIAEVCFKNNIMYIAWAYDSPALGGVDAHHFYSTNRIFLFDSVEIKKNKKKGKSHLYQLNLATNVKRMNSIKITPVQQLKYQSDISFVGQLYVTELQKVMEALSPYAIGFIQSLIDLQMKNYGCNLIEYLMTNKIADEIKSQELIEKMDIWNEKFGVPKNMFSLSAFKLFLGSAVTNRERIMLLSLLSKRYAVKLFSPDRNELLNDIKYMGTVDYLTEMPLVFRSSKINLNITLKSIEAGIPQRCIDIMGCHGFLLTNYQKDLFTELEEDKDVVVYRSLEEAVDKAGFYLKHDKLRRQIAENGYKKVRDRFNYHTQLGKIWKITGLK